MGKIILTLIIALGVTLISKEDEHINLFFLAISDYATVLCVSTTQS